jgi:glycosyltransferase involved in cell wall biosynthesis
MLPVAVTRAIATGAQGPQGPGYRIRLMLPAPELQRCGVTLLPLPLLSERQADVLHSGSAAARARAVVAGRRRLRRDLLRVEDAGVAVVQRQVDLLPGRGLERAVMHGRALVLDVDDAVWLPEPGGHPLGRLRRNADKLRWLASRADRVIAGNDYLAEWLAEHARDVTVVPSLVDTRRVAVKVHRDSSTIVLGWIGSPSTARYLHAVGAQLAAFAATNRDLTVRLIVVGGAAPEIDGVHVESWRWSEQQESDALALMDVGLMPLPDDAWTRGKCAYKALQYMSAGVPVVADDVGLTGTVVGDEGGGLLASSAADWPRALEQLAASADLRARLGARGRARVEADFSVGAWGPRLAAIIAGAA